MQEMTSFQPTIYQHRRRQLCQQIRECTHGVGGVAVVGTPIETIRSQDTDYPYRVNSQFYYLSGFWEAEAVLVIVAAPDPAFDRSLLFLREKDPEKETWEGIRLGVAAAPTTLGVDAAFPIGEWHEWLKLHLAPVPHVFLPFYQTVYNEVVGTLSKHQANQRRGGGGSPVLWDLAPILAEMRVIKDEHELALMAKAAEISAQGHLAAMRMCQPGLFEYSLEAELLHTFRQQGASDVAYNSIVAAGANACILHHRAGHAPLIDGDLCLIDAGCEYQMYAGDITRVFPINGQFSDPQRAVYDWVLQAQAAAIAVVRAGVAFHAVHDAALRVLIEGMLALKLLKKDTVGNIDDVIDNGSYRRFYMHQTSHWLGIDVHDVGRYREPAPVAWWDVGTKDGNPSLPLSDRRLDSQMVLTIEPGLYITPAEDVPAEFWNIGIRIEDDVVVTSTGASVLTRTVPVEASEIERVMRDGRTMGRRYG